MLVAEGLTGGVMSSRLSEVDQRMAIFRGGAVTADLDNAEQPGADRAVAAAAKIRGDFGTNVGLAVVTAGPRDEQPRATVFVGLDINGTPHTQAVSLPGDRNRFRNYAVINALNFLRRTLTGA